MAIGVKIIGGNTVAIYTKAGLNKVVKAQLIEIVLELQEENDKLRKEGYRVRLNKVISTKPDVQRMVKVTCTVKVNKTVNGKTFSTACDNKVEMSLVDARNTKGVVDCGQHS